MEVVTVRTRAARAALARPPCRHVHAVNQHEHVGVIHRHVNHDGRAAAGRAAVPRVAAISAGPARPAACAGAVPCRIAAIHARPTMPAASAVACGWLRGG